MYVAAHERMYLPTGVTYNGGFVVRSVVVVVGPVVVVVDWVVVVGCSIVVVPIFKTLITSYKIHTYICVYTIFEGANRKLLTLM